MSTRPAAAGPAEGCRALVICPPRPRLSFLHSAACCSAPRRSAAPRSDLSPVLASCLLSLAAGSNSLSFCVRGHHRSGGAPKSPAPRPVCACVSSWHRLHRHSKLLCASAKCGARKRGVLWCTCSAGEYRPRRLQRWHSLCCKRRASAAARCHIYVR